MKSPASTIKPFFPRCTHLICVAAFAVASAYGSSKLSTVDRIGIVGGERGIAMSILSNGPFDAGIEANGTTSFTLVLKRCRYNLARLSYTDFPPESPLQSIEAVEKEGPGVDIIVTMKREIRLPVKSLHKGNTWMALLSDKPAAGFAWNSSSPLPQNNTVAPAKDVSPISQSAAQNPVANDSTVHLRNVRFLQRGLICELALEFDAEVSGNLLREGSTVTVSVERAINGIGSKRLVLPRNDAFRNVTVSQENRGGVSGLKVAVHIDTSGIESNFNVAFTQGTVLSLFVMQRNRQKAALWTSGHGESWNYQFYDVPSYNVDMASIRKRAERDAAVRLTRENLFPVKESPKEAIQYAQSQLPQARSDVDTRVPQVVDSSMAVKEEGVAGPSLPPDGPGDRSVRMVNADKVNFREKPSLTGKVLGTLAKGDTVTLLRRHDAWARIEIQGQKGYVAGTFLGDTSRSAVDAAEEPAASLPVADAAKSQEATEENITRVSTTRLAEPASPSETLMLSPVMEIDTERVAHDSQTSRKRIVMYNGTGRDPFMPIVPTSFSFSGRPFVENLTLVGVLYDDDDRIALCEDAVNGRTPFALREHDPVERGKVLKIYRNKVVFLITEYGISRSYTLEYSRALPVQEASEQ